MKPKVKSVLIVLACVCVIVGSAGWIYFTQLRTTRYNAGLQQKIGQVLAEHSIRLLGKKGRIVAITIDQKEWPELDTQMKAFKTRLKSAGDFEVREYELDTKDQPKYGAGTGLSGRRYVRIINKNPTADLFVSFVGAPKLTDEDLKELARKPRLIAESRSGDNVPGLFEHKLVEAAVVSRFQFPSPGPEKPRTPEEWFVKRYQVITPDDAAQLSRTE
jgi:hypothetical protein